MIIPSFNLTATERVLPSMALDFTTASLDARVTFTRSGGTATVVNSSGFIESVGADTPRFDYDPVTLACKGLLIEESRSNAFTYSGNLAQSGTWTANNATAAANAASAPDGTTSAAKIIPNIGTVVYASVYRVKATAAQETVSAYFKAAEKTVGWIAWLGGVNGAYFDLSAVSVTTFGSGTTGTIADAGNGWYRCSITYTYVLGNGSVFFGCTDAVGSLSCTGNGSDGLYVWGAQYEAGAFVTSYIPTTTAQVTRNADVAVMTGTNFSDWFNASEGTMVAEASTYSPTATRSLFYIGDGTGDNRHMLFTAADAKMYSITRSSAATQSNMTSGSTISANSFNRLAYAYKENDFAFSANGTSVATDVTGILPTGVNQALLGGYTSTTALNGILKAIQYYPLRLTNAELQAFSK